MKNQGTVVVLGKFDGVHVAHTKLITTAVDISAQKGLESVVYSMYRKNAEVMTDNNQKTNIIKSLGVHRVVLRELDSSFMMLSAEEFVDSVLVDELCAACVVVGENFRFGKDRSADASQLKNLCFKRNIDVVVIDTLCIDNEPVSSTYVRSLLSSGNVAMAGKYLGRNFSVTGVVAEGKHLGRTLGFPTVNIYPDGLLVTPEKGVYATLTHCDGVSYPSVTNVGVNPTVESGKNIKAETHILGSIGDWYGKEIRVEFLEFIRPEIKFQTMEELAKQVTEDKQKAKEFHSII